MERGTASMKIKSYFANSVEQAIQEARQELGTEAMLITSRRSSPETRHLGAYEVIFGMQGQNGRARGNAPAADLRNELHNLRDELQEIKSTLQIGAPRGQNSPMSEAEELASELVAADLERKVALQVVADALAAREQMGQRPPASVPALRELAAASISQRLRFAPELSSSARDGARSVVFAGPAGAGKTTTLAKVAIQECLGHRLSARIISLDPSRVAAHEKLRSFAAIIGIGFTAANTVQEFQEAIQESRGKQVTLIDTPGYSGAEFGYADEVTGCLARINQKETHLVLSASMKRADLMRSVRQYEAFKPDYLLFTKLDETESLGAMLSTALEANKPFSFFTRGQSIPEDLEPASGQPLLASVFRREAAEAVSAA
jgi:flagellar biosynthesis protein FlhF